MLFFETAASPSGRDATGPWAGGARSGAFVGFVAYLAAKYVTAQTGDQVAGDMAGQAAAELAPWAIGCMGAGLGFIATAGRKLVQDRNKVAVPDAPDATPPAPPVPNTA